GYAYDHLTMVLAGALIGIGYGSITPIFQTQIINSVETTKIGLANSLFFNAMDTGLALGSVVMGLVMENVGYRSMYYLGAAVILLAAILYSWQMKAALASNSRTLLRKIK